MVLSACNTGRGDIHNSEGVFGLQRAFKLAGVDAILMSLWEVPDNATKELMQAFYSHYFAGLSAHTAFTKAQAEMRKKDSNPVNWAGFVLVE